MAAVWHGHLHPCAPGHPRAADTGAHPSPAPCPPPRGVSQVLATASDSPITNLNSCAPQDALSSKGFGTDLPLVNSQVEEHNIFHNEVMAIGPHIAKEGNKVSSPAPLPAALSGLALSRVTDEGEDIPPSKLLQPGPGWVVAQTHT